MAKQTRQADKHVMNAPHRTTSIGKSFNTSPKNKNKRRSYKAYRGQGSHR